MVTFLVSLDDPETNRAFGESVGATLVLLSDPEKNVAERYGVLAMGGRYAKRVTFYIDRKGTIVRIDRDVDTESHGKDIAESLQALGFAKKP